MFSADATYSYKMKIDSFKYGINILLTKNPGESLDSTICLFIYDAKLKTLISI